MKAIIAGNNLSTNKSDWEVYEEEIKLLNKKSSNFWTYDEIKSTNNMAFLLQILVM